MQIVRQLNPLSASVNNGIGRFYYFMGEYDKAIAQFLKRLDSDPTYAETHFSLTLAWFLKGEYDNAIESMEKAVTLSSYKLIILSDLAFIYGSLGRQDKVLEIKEEFDKPFSERRNIRIFLFTDLCGVK